VETASSQVAARVQIGRQPYGVVVDSARAYVSLSAAAQVAVIDLAARAVVRVISVEPFPTGLALSGDTLYVTHLYSGRITCIDLSSLAPEKVIATDAEANLSQAVALSHDGAYAYLPQTLSHTRELDLRPETAVSPVVNVLDLAASAYLPDARLDLAAADRAVNLPSAAALSPDGRWLFVANSGTDDVVVLDLSTRLSVADVPVGRSPRGLALTPDGARLFVANVLDGTLDVLDIDYQETASSPMPRLSHRATIRLTDLPLSPEVLLGKRLFNSALPPMSAGWLSCATCHLDGGHDARTWLGLPDGPRNTPALFGVARTAPFHWSGDFDELQDVEQTIRRIQGGAGLISGDADRPPGLANAGRSEALDALAAYVASLEAPPSPYAVDPGTKRRGEKAFERWGCATCHRPPLFTDRQLYDLPRDGIGDPALQRNLGGMRFDTPSLAGVWATAPYFHDGSAASLRETVLRAGVHGLGFAMERAELDDLLAYLRSLP
jgi:YVTN family beta-propeller protein